MQKKVKTKRIEKDLETRNVIFLWRDGSVASNIPLVLYEFDDVGSIARFPVLADQGRLHEVLFVKEE